MIDFLLSSIGLYCPSHFNKVEAHHEQITNNQQMTIF